MTALSSQTLAPHALGRARAEKSGRHTQRSSAAMVAARRIDARGKVSSGHRPERERRRRGKGLAGFAHLACTLGRWSATLLSHTFLQESLRDCINETGFRCSY